MAFTYEYVTPALIPNTIMQKRLRDGVDYQYLIEAAEGYVLHDNRSDQEEMDFDMGIPTGNMILRYATGRVSVAANYDFGIVVPDTIIDVNGNAIAVNKVGAFELFAVPESVVPADNIYGIAKPDHEVV